MPPSTRVFPHAAATRLSLLAALLVCGTAQAEQDPYYIGVSQGFTHDTNVFRGVGNQVGDTISSTGVLGGLDLHPGRQHLFANANAAANRYQDQKQLDNTSYSLSTGLDWQTVEFLSGGLHYMANQSLSNYSPFNAPSLKDVQKMHEGSATVRWGIAKDLGITAGANQRKTQYSVSNDRDFTEHSQNVGVQWGGSGRFSFGVSGRVSKGDTPRYRPVLPNVIPGPAALGNVEPDKSDRRDLDFTLGWTPSGSSKLSLRVSDTHDKHTAPSRGNFSGLTGAADWDYKPGGRTSLHATVMRETGNEAQLFSLVNLGLPGSLNVLNNRVTWITSLDATYELTGKIALTGNLRSSIGETDTSGHAGTFDSTLNHFMLSANYLATRAITIGCNLSHDWASGDYKVSTLGCSAQFVLR